MACRILLLHVGAAKIASEKCTCMSHSSAIQHARARPYHKKRVCQDGKDLPSSARVCAQDWQFTGVVDGEIIAAADDSNPSALSCCLQHEGFPKLHSGLFNRGMLEHRTHHVHAFASKEDPKCQVTGYLPQATLIRQA